MNRSNVKILAAVAAALIAVLIFMQFGGRDSATSSELLFPDLKTRINDITKVTITKTGDGNLIEISKQSENWALASRDNYPVSIAKLRQLLLQLADAKMVERKTANPARYHQLGVQDPDIEGSKGVRVQLDDPESSFDLIVGNLAQSGYRYVRVSGSEQSWLVDQDIKIPGDTGEWLIKDIVDIKPAQIRAVAINHPDGEEIRISKESADATDFDVVNIPDGRELSYATVANGIAGALDALTLDDVRRGDTFDAAVSTTFETFDGAQILVLTEKTADESWITVYATASDEENTSAADINARVDGWQFRLAEYKANQLTRRWDDILKAATD